jgi:Zn finger protein HypA/HybF involved in hydrogenase expression
MTIFDDVFHGISREVEKVQARSQEMLQGYNLNSNVRDLERKRTAKLLEIGRLVCDKYSRNINITEDLLKEKADEVTALEHEIGILQAEMDSLKTQADPNAAASTKAEAKAGFNPTPGYECPRCHAPASREKSFCPVCGEALKKSSNGADEIIDVEPENN